MKHPNDISLQTNPHTQEEIAPLARSYWEEEGRPEGKAEEHWHRAEMHLLGKRAEQKTESER